MNAIKNLFQEPIRLNQRGKGAEVTYYLFVVNDDPAVVSDRLDKRRVSNFLMKMS